MSAADDGLRADGTAPGASTPDDRDVGATPPAVGGSHGLMAAGLIKRIALLSAGLGALTAGGLAVLVSVPSGFSAVVGTALGVLNLWALAQLVTGLLDERRTTGRRARAAILLTIKALALVTVVGILVVKHWVRGGAMMAGLSVVAVSIVLGALGNDAAA